MLPHTAPSRSNCTAFSYAARGAIERLPCHDPQRQRSEGHSRSYSTTSITVNQAHRMPLHILLGATGLLVSPLSHKPPPETHPGLTAPKRKARSQSGRVLASCGPSAFTARLLCSGRMPSASIVPPASWPCCPSTFRLSRSPQPASRRINRSRPPNPSPNHPAAFCGRVPQLRRDPRPQNAVPES